MDEKKDTTPNPVLGASPIEVKTPNGHIVLIKPFVTGRARAAIRATLLGNMKMTGKAGTDLSDSEVSFSASAMQEANLKAMEMLIISCDGHSDGAYDAVLDLHEDDYTEVYNRVDEITKVSQINEKKKAA